MQLFHQVTVVLLTENHTINSYFCFTDTKDEYIFGDMITYECIEGHRLETDTSTVVCKEDGNFAPENGSIRCILVNCGAAPVIVNGISDQTEAKFNEVVNYFCDDG